MASKAITAVPSVQAELARFTLSSLADWAGCTPLRRGEVRTAAPSESRGFIRDSGNAGLTGLRTAEMRQAACLPATPLFLLYTHATAAVVFRQLKAWSGRYKCETLDIRHSR
jgi:hypothetical protein